MTLSKRVKLKRMEGIDRLASLSSAVERSDLGRPRVKAVLLLTGGFLLGIVSQRLGAMRSFILLNRAGMFL